MDHRSTARDWQTRLRLWAALIIGTFQLLYFVYYAAGVFSAEAMEAVMDAEGPVLMLGPLYTLALVTHMSLGLYKLYRRHTLVMPLWEACQIVLGLCLPFLLLPVNLSAYALAYGFGLSVNYVQQLLLSYPEAAWRTILMLLLVGAHAQIGVHVVLRQRPWYPRLRNTLAVVLTLLPVLAAVGYVWGTDPLYREALAGTLAADDQPLVLTPAQTGFLQASDLAIALGMAGIYVLLFGVRGLRLWTQRKNLTVTVAYPNGSAVKVLPSTTVLEASRIGAVPHASVCGGRGRCTTCRIRIEEGMENLSAVGDREHKALLRIGAAADIRLACQAEGHAGVIRVTPLLPPDVKSAEARAETKDSVGRDVELAVLFADLQGFTALSEQKFPYDVVYILNNYFQAMGRVIEAHGGRIDKFLGDGILAYFGLDQDPRQACAGALGAARDMAHELKTVNATLAHVLPDGLQIRLGIHWGNVVLGEVGFKDKRQLTIIGDTVNTASRLEALNKTAGSQLIVSTAAAAAAGADLSHLPVTRATLRGREEGLRVYVVKDILADLAGFRP